MRVRFFVCMFLSVAFTVTFLGTACAATLDRQGSAIPCTVTIKNHKYTTSEHSYQFHGYCLDGFQFSFFDVKGSWTSYNGATAESIETLDGKNGALTFNCPKDPWIYHDTNCTLTAIAGTMFSSGMPLFNWNKTLLKSPRPLSFNSFNSSEISVLIAEAANPQSSSPPPPPSPAKKKVKLMPGVLKHFKANIPSILKPPEGAAYCDPVPVEVQSSSPPSNPIVKIGFAFERYKKACGDMNNQACWVEKTIPGWQVINQPAVNSSIPRSGFPQKGKWRIRVRAYPHTGATSEWTKWRLFILKNDTKCP